jgi:hypothetical protein
MTAERQAVPGVWTDGQGTLVVSMDTDGEGSTWQPIETAPLDGTDVLLFFPLEGLNHKHSPQVIIASWRPLGRYGHSWVFQNRAVRGYSSEYLPTHWQPLPAPPAHLSTSEKAS